MATRRRPQSSAESVPPSSQSHRPGSSGSRLPIEFPHLRTQKHHLNNLPVQLTSFIGRERELSEVERLLATTRLLTLTGPGGCGKTRLALQKAVELDAAQAFADGVCWVELAALNDSALVPQAVAKALGVREAPRQPLIETLSNYLQPKHLLLLLDNCEHLRAVCAQLIQMLLLAVPDLQVLTTSREPLGIASETTWLVPSLSLPDAKHLPQPISNLTQYDAIQLFVERARSVLPTFALTDTNAAAIVQVCQRLDGIPLAIELAAARVNVLTAQQIAARLDDCFKLLTAGNRTALIPRHQTLRAVIDWSHDLLSQPERVLFRRLSVFAGEFTLEAAETICADENLTPTPPSLTGKGVGGISRREILDVLAHLLDKSLVVAETLGRSEARYRLLEMIRQYAREKLNESGEEALMRSRHRDWFLQLADQAEAELRGPRQAEWLERLENEYDNLRAALEWSKTTPEMAEPGLRLAVALLLFCKLRGYWREVRAWLEEFLSRVGWGQPTMRAKAHQCIAEVAWRQGDHTTVRAHLEESVKVWQELLAQPYNGEVVLKGQESDRTDQLRQVKCGLAYTMALLGSFTFELGDSATAHTLFEESLELARETRDKWVTGYALFAKGDIAVLEGKLEIARVLLEESSALFREVGDQWQLAENIWRLAEVAHNQGDLNKAHILFQETLLSQQGVENKNFRAMVLTGLGEVARSQGDYTQAMQHYEQSLALYRELGARLSVAVDLHNLGQVALMQGDHRRAAALFSESLILFAEAKKRRWIATCLAGLAGVARMHGLEFSPSRIQVFQVAAQLFGAAQAQLDSSGAVFEAADRGPHEHNLRLVRAVLDEATFAKAWAEGQALTLEQAIAEAQSLAARVKSESEPVQPPTPSPEPLALAEPLNEREREVLHLIADGLSNHEIAERLVIALSTVKWHVGNLFDKLGVHSRTQAVARAKELGLL